MYKKCLIFLIIALMLPFPVQGKETDEAVIARIREQIEKQNLPEAEKIILEKLSENPEHADFILFMAKILYWQQKYDESLKYYEKLIVNDRSDELAAEYEKVREAKLLEEISQLEKEGRLTEYEEKLLSLHNSSGGRIVTGYPLVMLYTRTRQFEKALPLMEVLIEKYPDNYDIKLLYIETLVINRDYSKASQELNNLTETELEKVAAEREDLLYRVKTNYVFAYGTYYHYTNNLPPEKNISLEIMQNFGPLTLVPRYSYFDRFDNRNNQFALDTYLRLPDSRWFMFNGSFSPDSSIVPIWSAGAEFYQGISNFELFAGFRSMAFHFENIHLLSAGTIIYLPYNIALKEKLYISTDGNTLAFLSGINYEPDHKIKLNLSLSAGKLSQRFIALQDFKNTFTWSALFTSEYRLTSSLAMFAEALYDHRSDNYNIFGPTIGVKYLW